MDKEKSQKEKINLREKQEIFDDNQDFQITPRGYFIILYGAIGEQIFEDLQKFAEKFNKTGYACIVFDGPGGQFIEVKKDEDQKFFCKQ